MATRIETLAAALAAAFGDAADERDQSRSAR